MFKFLGYMKSSRSLHERTIHKFEKLATATLRENPPRMNVERYMVTIDPNYVYYNERFCLVAYYYERLQKCRIIFYNNTGEKEIEMFMKDEAFISSKGLASSSPASS